MSEVAAPAETARLRAACVEAHRAGRRDEARRLYAAYLAQVPGDGGMWSNLGALLRTEQAFDQALRAQRRAIALDPQATGVRNNLANILSDLGLYDESLAVRRGLLAEAPGDVAQKAMIGRCLRGQGRYDAAAAWLRTVAAEHPEEAEPRIQLAFAELAAQRFESGFSSYEARWQGGELTPPDLPYDKFDGTQDVAGKTVLVMPEQGFGDAILFTRFLPQLKARGARVLFRPERPLARLMAALPGTDLSHPDLPPTEPVDYWMTMMDLPRLGLRTAADIPPPVTLQVPEASRVRARAIAAPHRDKLRVGVVWTGSLTYRGNGFRSFSHTEFLPLADIPGVQLFSLYKGEALAAYQADGSSAFLIDAGSSDRDFADCAATMLEMDLVISSDTATAHLAGSLGVPVWVPLHWDPFWIYRHEGATTPWYPSMRLYRQEVPRDWSNPFARMAEDLGRLAAGRVRR